MVEVGHLQLHPKDAVALTVGFALALIPALHLVKQALGVAVAPGVVLDLAHPAPMAVALQNTRPDDGFPIRWVILQVDGHGANAGTGC